MEEIRSCCMHAIANSEREDTKALNNWSSGGAGREGRAKKQLSRANFRKGNRGTKCGRAKNGWMNGRTLHSFSIYPRDIIDFHKVSGGNHIPMHEKEYQDHIQDHTCSYRPSGDQNSHKSKPSIGF